MGDTVGDTETNGVVVAVVVAVDVADVVAVDVADVVAVVEPHRKNPVSPPHSCVVALV